MNENRLESREYGRRSHLSRRKKLKEKEAGDAKGRIRSKREEEIRGKRGQLPFALPRKSSQAKIVEHINPSPMQKGAMRQKATKGIRKENKPINLPLVLGILIVYSMIKKKVKQNHQLVTRSRNQNQIQRSSHRIKRIVISDCIIYLYFIESFNCASAYIQSQFQFEFDLKTCALLLYHNMHSRCIQKSQLNEMN